MNKNVQEQAAEVQTPGRQERMTSVEIAEITGKQHKDVMRAIRAMEPAWEKVRGRKFALTFREVKGPRGAVRKEPMYSLTKTECLYVATKFNDEARARLVIRWEELEAESARCAAEPAGKPQPPVQISNAALRLAAEMQQASEAFADALTDGGRRDFLDYLLLTMRPASFYTVAADYGFTIPTLLEKLAILGIVRRFRTRDYQGPQFEIGPLYKGKGYLRPTSDPERVEAPANLGGGFTADCEWTPKGRIFLYAQLRSVGILPVLERNILVLTTPKR